MYDFCKTLDEMFTEDLFSSDQSPYILGGYFPDIVKEHRKFDKKAKKHQENCEICIKNKLQKLLGPK